MSKWTVSTKGIIVCTRNMAVTYNKEALCYQPQEAEGEMKIALTKLYDLKHQCSSSGQML